MTCMRKEERIRLRPRAQRIVLKDLLAEHRTAPLPKGYQSAPSESFLYVKVLHAAKRWKRNQISILFIYNQAYQLDETLLQMCNLGIICPRAKAKNWERQSQAACSACQPLVLFLNETHHTATPTLTASQFKQVNKVKKLLTGWDQSQKENQGLPVRLVFPIFVFSIILRHDAPSLPGTELSSTSQLPHEKSIEKWLNQGHTGQGQPQAMPPPTLYPENHPFTASS